MTTSSATIIDFENARKRLRPKEKTLAEIWMELYCVTVEAWSVGAYPYGSPRQ